MLQLHIKESNLLFKAEILNLVGEFLTNQDRSLRFSFELISMNGEILCFR